jgi:hypothetical protein
MSMRKRRSPFVAALTAGMVFCAGLPTAAAEEKPVLAVLPFNFLHLALLDPKVEADRVRQAFAGAGRFAVLSEADTLARLKAAGVKDERCQEVECAVEFGGALKVQKVFTAQVLQLGRRVLIRVRYVDVPSAKAELAESVEIVGEPSQVSQVMGVIVGKVLVPEARPPTKLAPVVLAFDGPKEPFYTKAWFLVTIGTLIAAGAATGLALGLRSQGPGTGGATFSTLRAAPR